MGPRGRALVAFLLLLALTLAGALVERTRAGIERSYLCFVLPLVGPALRLWLVTRGRSEPMPAFVIGCVLLGFTGLVGYPFASWGLMAGGIAAFWLALPVSRQDPSPVRATL